MAPPTGPSNAEQKQALAGTWPRPGDATTWPSRPMVMFAMGGNTGQPFQLPKEILAPNGYGYQQYLHTRVAPWIRAGYDVGFHRPWGEGTAGDYPMDFDSRVQLMRSEHMHVAIDFEQMLTDPILSDRRVMVYAGTWEFECLQLMEGGRFLDLVTHMLYALGRALELPNVHFTIDASVVWRDDHPFTRMLMLLETMLASKHRILAVESLPAAKDPGGFAWQRGKHAFTIERGYWSKLMRQLRESEKLGTDAPFDHRMFANDALTFRWWTNHPDEDGIPPRWDGLSADGFTTWLAHCLVHPNHVPVVSPDITRFFSGQIPHADSLIDRGLASARRHTEPVMGNWSDRRPMSVRL